MHKGMIFGGSRTQRNKSEFAGAPEVWLFINSLRAKAPF